MLRTAPSNATITPTIIAIPTQLARPTFSFLTVVKTVLAFVSAATVGLAAMLARKSALRAMIVPTTNTPRDR